MNQHVVDDLPLDVLGLGDERERAAVERHLNECDSCRAALRREEEVAWTLAESVAREPSRGLRERIVAPHRREPAAAWRLAFAAALAVAVIAASAFALSRNELARERALHEEYAKALNAVAASGRVVPLVGEHGQGALVLPRSGDQYVVLALPEPPPGMTYEAWIIRGDAALPAGLATPREGVMIMRLTVATRPGDAAAVTLEPAGGVEQPTSEPILLGKL